MTRRALLPAVIAIALVLPAPARATEPPYSNADYCTFADGIMRNLDSWWDPGRDAYSFRGSLSVRVNSALLLTHAIAAHNRRSGPTRQDARARVLVERLTAPPVWLGASVTGRLSTCWSRDLDRVKRQHPSLEPKVAEAVAWLGWRAPSSASARKRSTAVSAA